MSSNNGSYCVRYRKLYEISIINRAVSKPLALHNGTLNLFLLDLFSLLSSATFYARHALVLVLLAIACIAAMKSSSFKKLSGLTTSCS